MQRQVPAVRWTGCKLRRKTVEFSQVQFAWLWTSLCSCSDKFAVSSEQFIDMFVKIRGGYFSPNFRTRRFGR